MKQMFYSMGYMFLATLLLTSLVSAVKITHEERIQKNQQVKLQSTILRVLEIPIKENASSLDIFDLFNKRIKTIKVQARDFYLGYHEDERTLKGYAFSVGGPGFWGPIFGMVAVNPEATKILGIAFYKHSETPGLGGRITEDWFAEQFTGVPLYPVNENQKIFYLIPESIEKSENELDAITGATQTSHAVERFVNNELDRFLKDFWKKLEKDMPI